jgi:hypothetical protein
MTPQAPATLARHHHGHLTPMEFSRLINDA